MDAFFHVLRRGVWLRVRCWFRVATLISVLAVSGGVAAQGCLQYRAVVSVPNNPLGPWVGDKGSACSAVSGTYMPDVNAGAGACQNVRTDYGDGNIQYVTWSFQTQACPANACTPKTGTQGSSNFTVGWTRSSPTADKNEFVGGLSPPASNQCVGGCSVTVGGASAGFTHGSLTPSPQGLYRVSGDYFVTYSGQQCAVSASDPGNPASPPKSCDGFVGQINGETRCVSPVPGGAASAPIPTAAGGSGAGNPAAGSDGGLPVGDPARTTAGGTGGPGGGPAGAGGGGPLPNAGGGSGGAGAANAGPPVAGTGAPNGGSPTTGTDGKNKDQGKCDLNPSAAGCGGSASAQPASLYTASTKTFASALTGFRDKVNSSPVGASVGGFLTVSGGGSCPTWPLHIPFINADVNFDIFCSSFASAMLAFMKVSLMVVAGFMAFRIAVDN